MRRPEGYDEERGLVDESRLHDCRLSGLTASRVSLAGVKVDDLRLQGCVLSDCALHDVEIGDTVLRDCRLKDVDVVSTRMKDCRWEAVSLSRLRASNSTLRKVVVRDASERGQHAGEGMTFLDSELDDVAFIGCNLSGTTFQGARLSHIRIAGADLSGLTITAPADIEGFARRS